MRVPANIAPAPTPTTAGAAQSLGAGALLVNPWNITDMAQVRACVCVCVRVCVRVCACIHEPCCAFTVCLHACAYKVRPRSLCTTAGTTVATHRRHQQLSAC